MSHTVIAASVFLCLTLQARPVSAQTASDRTDAQNRIVSAEKAVIEAIVKNDPKTFHSYVVADSYAVGGEGVVPVTAFDEMMKEMKANCKVTKWELSDSKFYWLNDSAVVHMYKATMDGTCQNQPISATWASSVWVNRGGKWLGSFHQESEVVVPPAKK